LSSSANGGKHWQVLPVSLQGVRHEQIPALLIDAGDTQVHNPELGSVEAGAEQTHDLLLFRVAGDKQLQNPCFYVAGKTH
jgi:hypothetical protein